MTISVFQQPKSEDCEAHIASSIKAEMQKLWDRTVVHIKQAMEARRHPEGDYEPDFGERLRRLEAQEFEPQVRIERYDENGGGRLLQWILGIVGTLIAMGIGGVIYELSDLKSTMAASLARQEQDEKRLDRLEQHVYRGAP